jgi:hypothetical protein
MDVVDARESSAEAPWAVGLNLQTSRLVDDVVAHLNRVKHRHRRIGRCPNGRKILCIEGKTDKGLYRRAHIRVKRFKHGLNSSDSCLLRRSLRDTGPLYDAPAGPLSQLSSWCAATEALCTLAERLSRTGGLLLLPDLVVDLDRTNQVLGGELQSARRSAGLHIVRNKEAGHSLEAILLAGYADSLQLDRDRLAARILASEVTEQFFKIHGHRANSLGG